MVQWHSFGSGKKKSTKQLYKELKKLQEKNKEEQERYLIESNIRELKHKKRTVAINKAKSFFSSLERGAYKVATSKQAKKLSREIQKELNKK